MTGAAARSFASGGIIPSGRYVMTQGERAVTMDTIIISAEEMRRQACDHADAAPVDSIVTGEILAHWCEACETQLPAEGDEAPMGRRRDHRL